MAVENVDWNDVKEERGKMKVEEIAEELKNGWDWDAAIKKNVASQSPEKRAMWNAYFKEHPESPVFTPEQLADIDRQLSEIEN